MQTVQELIDLLNTIEDKTMPIGTYRPEDKEWGATLNPIKSVSIETKKVLNAQTNEYDQLTFIELINYK